MRVWRRCAESNVLKLKVVFKTTAHNDFADIEGETDDLIRLREELVEFAHDRGEGHSSKDLQVAVSMQVKIYFIWLKFWPICLLWKITFPINSLFKWKIASVANIPSSIQIFEPTTSWLLIFCLMLNNFAYFNFNSVRDNKSFH